MTTSANSRKQVPLALFVLPYGVAPFLSLWMRRHQVAPSLRHWLVGLITAAIITAVYVTARALFGERVQKTTPLRFGFLAVFVVLMVTLGDLVSGAIH